MLALALLDDYGRLARALPAWERLAGRVAITALSEPLRDAEVLSRRLAGHPVVVAIRDRTWFTADLIARLPALRLLALAGPYTGQVDLAAAAARGIAVTETDGSTTNAFEHTVALLMAAVRRVPQEDRAMRAGRWQTPPLGVDLAGRSLGVVGLGIIGGKMAAFGRLLGMRVLAAGLTLTDERAAAAGAIRVDLDTLMRESDVVSLHLRLSDRTRGIVTARHLGLMKPTAFLVNTARARLVDEDALVAALRERRIAGAALDVFGAEPLPADHPLLALDNVVVSPHLGFVTVDGYATFFDQVVDSVAAFLDGRPLARAVTPAPR